MDLSNDIKDELTSDLEQLLLDQNAEIGVLLKIILQGYTNKAAPVEEVIQIISNFADALILKSPEAALSFRKEVEEKTNND